MMLTQIKTFDKSIVLLLAFLAISPVPMGMWGPWFGSYICAAFAFVVALLIRDKRHHFESVFSVGLYYSVAGLLPYAIFLFLTLMQIFMGANNYVKPTRPLSLFLQQGSFFLLMMAFLLTFGKKAVNRLFDCVALAYVLTFICGLILGGPLVLLDFLAEGTVSNYSPYFEVHDICLIMPLFVLYYLLASKDTTGRNTRLLIALAISVIGFKRIAIAALLMVLPAGLVLRRARECNCETAFEALVKTAVFALSLLWVWLIFSSGLSRIMQDLGIEMMGRNVIYSYFSTYLPSDFFELGRGYGFCRLRLSEIASSHVLGNMSGIRAIHSDLLEKCIEGGWALFFLAIAYYLIALPYDIRRRFGSTPSRMYLLAIAYAFVVYTTDNAAGYLVFQVALFLVPAHASYLACRCESYAHYGVVFPLPMGKCTTCPLIGFPRKAATHPKTKIIGSLWQV